MDAVRCAVEIQRAMIDRNADISEDKRIVFRIGVNLGDVIVEPEDTFGDGVNIAARIEALAEPGGNCISRVVRDQIRDKLPYPFEDMGEQSVKNIARPVHVYRVRLDAEATASPAVTRVDEETFVFGPFRLIPAQRLLLDDEKPLRLGSRALDILTTLVEGAGETIHKDRLIARAWPDTIVDDGALRVHIAALRKALGDGRAGGRFIANNPGRGYTFVAPVTREHQHSAPATPDGGTAANNLPVPLTRIVGRDNTVAALAKQLAQRRLLTIVGPGGIGKTTVAVAVAEAVTPDYADGVWFVGLASLPDPDLVPSTVSTVLGIAQSGTNPISGLTAWLRDKHA